MNETVIARLELYAEEFETLATTPAQVVLAAGLKAFVADLKRSIQPGQGRPFPAGAVWPR